MSKRTTANPGITIGLDLGDRHTQCCSLDNSGEIEETLRALWYEIESGPGS